MNGRRLARLALVSLALGAVSAACVASRGGDTRFDAVEGTLVAMGLAPLGPPSHVVLAQGGEYRRVVDLVPGCVTFVAVGDDGIRDVDLAVSDASGAPLAHDTTHAPQAAARVCVEKGGKYTVVVTARSGGGAVTFGAWSGDAVDDRDAAPAASSSAAAASAGAGTCASPRALAAGETQGTLAHGAGVSEGSCGRSSGSEMVYALDLAARARVALDLRGSFDTVLYVRRADCAEPSEEIACNDDAGAANLSHLDAVLEPGSYFVFVDGFEPGTAPMTYSLTTTVTDVPSLVDVCRRARPLAIGRAVSGETTHALDTVHASCGDGAHGLDAAFRLDVPARARVRVRESSDDFHPVVHVRRICAAEESEIACAGPTQGGGDAVVARVLDPGSYAVFADGEGEAVCGPFTLRADTAPEAGSGAAGDACADALPLALGQDVAGDTFEARDDVATSCGARPGAAGGPDVVYRFDVAQPSLVHAALTRDEGRHVVAIARVCGDRSTELQCGVDLGRKLAPGSYAAVVEARSVDDVGAFVLRVDARDVSAQEQACKAVSRLTPGRPITGTLSGAPARFDTSCGGAGGGSGGDRVYSLELTKRSTVILRLATPGGDAVLALRRSCVDTSYAPAVAEIACMPESGTPSATIAQALDPGVYYVVVEARDATTAGAFTLTLETRP